MTSVFQTITPFLPERSELNALALADPIHFQDAGEPAAEQYDSFDQLFDPDNFRDLGGLGVEPR
ncbi:MAG: hypothetical protein ABSF22_06250 [Bryobacteraceae bacterium]